MDLDIELLALLKCKDGGGSSVTVEPLTVTENGTTTAPEGTAYSPVTVNVQLPLGYLTFGNIAYLSVTDPVWDGTMYISDDAEQWSEWDGTRFEPGESHTIYLRGSGNTRVSNDGHSFSFEAYDSNEGGVTCEGNIENLLDAQKVAKGVHPTMNTNCYAFMFQGCTSLTTAPSLPATTLASGCYKSMFRDCTSLTTAPILPATTLASNCYSAMFLDCTSLTTAPILPATTLAMGCYSSMFLGCTSLTTAPELPATTVADRCYYSMFRGCTNLITLPALPATTLAIRCYVQMFDGCGLIKLSSTSTGEYTTPYRIPFQGTGTTATYAFSDMFRSTGGTFRGTPAINTTYYTSNAIPELTKLTANGMHNVAQYNYAEVDVPGANLVALTATDNDTTYNPADYNADGFSSVSVEIAVPQVYVAQKQVSGNVVTYDFGVNVESCAVAPLQSEAANLQVGMDLNFRSPCAIDLGGGSSNLVFDGGSFFRSAYRFTANHISAENYPSALYAVAPN